MSKIVPLDNVRHGKLRVLTGHGAEFGEATNQVPLFVSEFAEAQRHYPILFRKDDAGALQPLAVLGFDRGENLSLCDGTWTGHVPAVFRRGPLALAGGEGEDPSIMIDLDHPRVREGGDEGAPLFLEHGGHAPALESAVAALQQIHAGAAAAPRMEQLFAELALVEPVALRVQLTDGRTITFEGFHAVAEDRLAALDGEQLAKLNRAGLIAPAIHAASSLANMQRLIARKHRRDAGA